MRKLSTLLVSLFFIISAYGQEGYLDTLKLEGVVITGTKYPVSVEKSGKTIYKLTGKQLESNAGKTVADLLNEVPGIQVDGNFGAPGTNISYFVRGGSNQQTLILIDGSPLNDPSGLSLSYDLRQLSVEQIESIEVLKGGLSTLYGTGASAAVINIKLKQASKKPLEGSANLYGGSFGTFGQGLSLGGTADRLSYFLSANNISSEGFSAAQNNDPSQNFDDDGFNQRNGLLRLGYKANDRLKIDFLTGYDYFDADFDGGAFFDSEDSQESRQLRFGISPSYIYKNGVFKLNALYNTNERQFLGSFPSTFKGRNLQIDANNRHEFSPLFSGMLGANLQSLSYEQEGIIAFDDSRFTILDPYASVFLDLPEGLNVHAGVRINTHSEYGSHFIYNVNPSYLFGDDLKIKVLASVSTAFITPSLVQLFSFFGNDQLEPEESTNYELGASLYTADKKLIVNAVYFRRDEENPIGFISEFDDMGNFIGGQYVNIANERTVDGFELDVTLKVLENLDVVANYSYTDSDNPASFYRIPNHKFGVNVNYKPIDQLTTSLKFNYTGDRQIFSFTTFEEVDLDSYQLIDLYASYGFLEQKISVYGSINNLFDEDFVAIEGFTTRGRNYTLGVKYKF